MSATARATATASRPARPNAPSSPSAATRRPALREVPAPAPVVAGNGMFAIIVTGLLVLGMLGLLVLNTTLAQGAFEIGALTKIQRDLAVNEQRLLQTVAHAESPESLQQRADALGMVPAQAPVFLRLADHRVLGRPTPAKAVVPKAVNAAAVPVTSDAATVDPPTAAAGPRSSGGTTTGRNAGSTGSTGADSTTSDEARPDAPTGPSTVDEAVPDPPTAGATP